MRLNSRQQAALIVAIALVVFLATYLIIHSSGTEYKLRFKNAGQLVVGDKVQVGGRAIGEITKISLTKNYQAEVEVRLNSEFVPLHEGTKAVIRSTSLAGIANRYIALTPGPNNAKKLSTGAVITSSRTTSPVDLDQIFNTLSPREQKGLKEIISGSAEQYGGKGKEVNATLRNLKPAVTETDLVVRELDRDQQALTKLIVSSAGLVDSVSSSRDELSQLIANTNQTVAAVADQSESLDQALAVLPDTVRRANTTFVNLRSTLDDLDELVVAAKPNTKTLSPFLRDLRPLLRDSRPTLAKLNSAVRRKGTSNDAVELLTELPSLEQVATPAAKNTVKSLKASQEIVEFLRAYSPELIGWVRDLGQGAAYYDANGHYIRVMPLFGKYSYLADSNSLQAVSDDKRYDGYTFGDIDRCPGSAAAAPDDASAPYLGDGITAGTDCDPDLIPGGR